MRSVIKFCPTCNTDNKTFSHGIPKNEKICDDCRLTGVKQSVGSEHIKTNMMDVIIISGQVIDIETSKSISLDRLVGYTVTQISSDTNYIRARMERSER